MHQQAAEERLAAAVALLSSSQVRSVCASKSGKHWAALLQALEEFDVAGDWISEHVQSSGTLHAFLVEQLELTEVPRPVSRQLHRLITNLARASLSDGGAGGGGGGGTGARADPGLAPPLPIAGGAGLAPCPQQQQQQHLISLRIRAWDTASETKSNLTIDVESRASIAAVQRCLLDRVGKGLTASVVLSHAGLRLEPTADAPVAWTTLSAVHAVIDAEGSNPLTLENAPQHPIAAARVELDSQRSLQETVPGRTPNDDAAGGGVSLHIFDAGASLGNGAFGAVYRGVAKGANAEQPVAVKKFFMLENPLMYGLADARAVNEWVSRDLLPEVNLLAGLAHPNVVRLRCVGMRAVHGSVVPGFVAMDLCTGGTIEGWMRQKKLTHTRLVGFLRDLLDAMLYLHDVKRLVHRDLKPNNLFVQLGSTIQQRPRLVVGDVGLARQVARTASLVSAAGAAAYRAPEAMADAARCSQASDVYSASLVAVEMLTGKCVYSECGADSVKKQSLVQEAKGKIREVLAFADDFALTVPAVDLLLTACTLQVESSRPTFNAIDVLTRGDSLGLGLGPRTTTAAAASVTAATQQQAGDGKVAATHRGREGAYLRGVRKVAAQQRERSAAPQQQREREVAEAAEQQREREAAEAAAQQREREAAAQQQREREAAEAAAQQRERKAAAQQQREREAAEAAAQQREREAAIARCKPGPKGDAACVQHAWIVAVSLNVVKCRT